MYASVERVACGHRQNRSNHYGYENNREEAHNDEKDDSTQEHTRRCRAEDNYSAHCKEAGAQDRRKKVDRETVDGEAEACGAEDSPEGRRAENSHGKAEHGAQNHCAAVDRKETGCAKKHSSQEHRAQTCAKAGSQEACAARFG